jgi:hypothetical protein
MSYINMQTNASYNFVAPNISKDADKKMNVVFPTTEKLDVPAAASISIPIERVITIVDLGTLAADATLNLVIGDDIPVGALLTIKAKSDGTARTITLGTGLQGSAIAGVASKTKAASFIYDGEKFVAMAAAIQLD